jgi:mRNA interferase MazF
VTHGNYGKPRPAVVVQDDTISGLHSIVVCPFTSELRSDIPMWRLNLMPSADNGLKRACQVMIDKIAAAAPTEIRRSIGRLTSEEMDEISASLAVLLGLAS